MTETLTIKEKVGYGLGDTASNIVFQVVVNFMMFFYTDVYGISAAAVGTLMLVVRIFDGITDPIMGGIADRTNTRWGRYRPYLIMAAIPYGVLAVVAFTTPDLSQNGKLIYAYVTYALLMTAYTAINIPYSALGGVITGDAQERASVQSYRFAMAMVGGAIVTALLMPMVDWFGGGDQARGFQLAMAILASVAVICFILCFFITRERIVKNDSGQKTNLLQDALSLLKNDQWLIAAAIAFVMLVLVAMRGAVSAYYVKYYLLREDLISAYITSGFIASVLGALVANFAIRKICKISLFKIGCIGLIVFHALLYFVPANMLIMSFAMFSLAHFFQLFCVPIMFSMIADSADYGELKTGRNIMGMCFSGQLLVIKLGLAVGGALAGWLLAAYGYVPNQEQTAQAILGIKFNLALVPVICGIVILFLVHFYKLTNIQLTDIKAKIQNSGNTMLKGDDFAIAK